MERFPLKGVASTKMNAFHYIARVSLKIITPNKRNGFQQKEQFVLKGLASTKRNNFK